MGEREAEIENVSDTALWVANFRALESERRDAAFRDPLASVLVGERGRRISRAMPYGRLMAWVMVVRTVAIDRLIMRAVELGADTVINLGAGLDTRPYRMKLPSDLRWIEVDFPHMIDHKNEKLRDERPACRLERIALDLTDRSARRELFSRLGSGSKSAVIITEGVIPYLSNEDASSLATDLHAVPAFRYWIQDFYDIGLKRSHPKAWTKRMKSSPFLFKVPDWMEFFAQQGWRSRETLYSMDEGKRLGRPFPFIFPWALFALFMPRRKQERYRKMSGFVLLERA